MLWLLKNRTYSKAPILRGLPLCDFFYKTAGLAKWGPIGVDIGDDTLKLAQLANNGKGVSLIASGSENRPADVKPGSGNWQRWAVETIKKLTANGEFRGRDVIAAIPASEVFIDHIKMPRTKKQVPVPNAKKSIWDKIPFAKALSLPPQGFQTQKNAFGDLQNGNPKHHKQGPRPDDKLQNALFSKVKQKLHIEPDDAMIRYIPAEQDNVLVIATEREKIDRHLAIYEKANLRIKSVGIWPIALINSYTSFFGRRKSDIEAIVMLLNIETNCTNVVICRHKNLLFARSIPIGAKQLERTPKHDERRLGEKPARTGTDEVVTRLVLALTACRRHFGSMYKKTQIERLIFLSGRAVDRDICATIAKQLEMPAQMGDCLAAMEIANPSASGVDRRNCQANWATALGLSLS